MKSRTTRSWVRRFAPRHTAGVRGNDMTKRNLQLIQAARSICKSFKLRQGFIAGEVGAALRTIAGNVYTGICVDLGCGVGFCAEVAAIAEMLKNRETQIESIVAVRGNQIMPPCGRCRETMAQLDGRNFESRIIIGEDQEVTLKELLPKHWLEFQTKK